MKPRRKVAKDFLREATLTDFWDVVREAKITKADQRVLDARFIEGKTIVEISMEYGYSIEKVNKIISTLSYILLEKSEQLQKLNFDMF